MSSLSASELLRIDREQVAAQNEARGLQATAQVGQGTAAQLGANDIANIQQASIDNRNRIMGGSLPGQSNQRFVAQQLAHRGTMDRGGPSIAELQQQEGLRRAIAGQASLAASNPSINPALAQRLAAEQTAQLQQGAIGQGALLRAQEEQMLREQQLRELQASGALSGNLSAQRLQQMGLAEQTGLAQAGMLGGLMGGNVQQQNAMAQALIQAQLQQQQLQQQQAQFDASQQITAKDVLGGATQVVGLGVGGLAGRA